VLPHGEKMRLNSGRLTKWRDKKEKRKKKRKQHCSQRRRLRDLMQMKSRFAAPAGTGSWSEFFRFAAIYIRSRSATVLASGLRGVIASSVCVYISRRTLGARCRSWTANAASDGWRRANHNERLWNAQSRERFYTRAAIRKLRRCVSLSLLNSPLHHPLAFFSRNCALPYRGISIARTSGIKYVTRLSASDISECRGIKRVGYSPSLADAYSGSRLHERRYLRFDNTAGTRKQLVTNQSRKPTNILSLKWNILFSFQLDVFTSKWSLSVSRRANYVEWLSISCFIEINWKSTRRLNEIQFLSFFFFFFFSISLP